MLFISGAEIVFIFFIVLLIFGADKIPSIARGLAKGITQVKQATNEIKSEIQKSADLDPSKQIGGDIQKEINQVKEDFDNLTNSVKRKF
ncbi:MAG: twin-arginine translocase TatA/TatE family subunit [Flavobacteriaceae bacterium]|jgi:sec-independent protein translocase protein TatA|nr:twin-arginine translocase TatA/TatE family subunit [Flavobacteriaceae bacterium]